MAVHSVYIHVPFCLRKCAYCDFYSLPWGEEQETFSLYGQLLLKELSLWEKGKSLDFSGVRTVYFGGGTPSLLAPKVVADLTAAFPSAEEVTLEANPETVDAYQLAAYRAAGVNRLSLGVQSFCDGELARMGRGHSSMEAKQAVADARSAGFENISIDLIYGLPDQSLQSWAANLEQALALETEHISLYALSLHEGTPWGDAEAAGLLEAADEDLSADMLELAMDELPKAGFLQYEISNFARPGFESRHNSAYWLREDYLGLGSAAAGCLGDVRYENGADLAAYRQCIERGRLAVAEEEHLDLDMCMGETVFLALRLAAGLELARFRQLFAVDALDVYEKEFRELEAAGLIEMDQGWVRLTGRGRLLGNQVFVRFV